MAEGSTIGNLMDRDVDVARDPKRRKLIHQASRRVTGTAAADQEFISRLSIELGSTMYQLQHANITLMNYQDSQEEIRKLQV